MLKFSISLIFILNFHLKLFGFCADIPITNVSQVTDNNSSSSLATIAESILHIQMLDLNNTENMDNRTITTRISNNTLDNTITITTKIRLNPTVSSDLTVTSSPPLQQLQTVTIPMTTKRPVPVKTTPVPVDPYYQCPLPGRAEFQLFPLFCNQHEDCLPVGKNLRCCMQYGSKRCVKGIPRPPPEPKHDPLLWFIPRHCPKEPLAELFWELKTCQTDVDCWPRVCCPDGRQKYCRTSRPDLNAAPFGTGRQLSSQLDTISEYIQCTPPPAPIYDLHPKTCNSTLDCFPNVCCQEAGKRNCRPPRRSLLSLLTGVASRLNFGLIQQWTRNLVIR